MGLPQCWCRSQPHGECLAVQHVRRSPAVLYCVERTIQRVGRFVQASSIVYSQIYRTDDAPRCVFLVITYR
jgi:hypothetical protein